MAVFPFILVLLIALGVVHGPAWPVLFSGLCFGGFYVKFSNWINRISAFNRGVL